MTTSSPCAAPLSSRGPALVSRARHATMQGFTAALVRLIAVWRDRARSRAQLRGLDDRMLRDIGMDYDSVRAETRKRFWMA